MFYSTSVQSVLLVCYSRSQTGSHVIHTINQYNSIIPLTVISKKKYETGTFFFTQINNDSPLIQNFGPITNHFWKNKMRKVTFFNSISTWEQAQKSTWQ